MSFDKGPSGKPVNVFYKLRKDGKYAVTFCFHARQLRKVITAEQLEECRNDEGYNVLRGTH